VEFGIKNKEQDSPAEFLTRFALCPPCGILQKKICNHILCFS